MALAVWRNEYLTGDETVDAQHRHLFEIINNLTDAMLLGLGSVVLKQTLIDLYNYTEDHFLEEERLMFSKKYPGFMVHREQHNELKAQLEVLMEKHDQYFGSMTIEVAQFLTNWLIDHIKSQDAEVMKYLANSSPHESYSMTMV